VSFLTKTFDLDSEVFIGLYETFQRMVSDARTRFLVDQQLEKYVQGSKGAFWIGDGNNC